LEQINLQYHILPDNQLNLYQKLKAQSWIGTFYLAGGTALALQIGHRRSLDFDFFSNGDFDNSELDDHLSIIGKFQRIAEEKNTLHGLLEGINISFIGYKYPLLEEPIKDDFLRIARIIDIACMKLSAITARGNKKDFIDLFFILKSYSLEELFRHFEKKYQLPDYEYVLLKALVYFVDAEEDPMPVMLTKITWEDVKEKIIKAVKNFKVY